VVEAVEGGDGVVDFVYVEPNFNRDREDRGLEKRRESPGRARGREERRVARPLNWSGSKAWKW
jgi:hypothetical protein